MTRERIVRGTLASVVLVLGVAACPPELPAEHDAGVGGSTAIGGTATGSGGRASTGGSAGSGPRIGPCDLYAAASPATPCVAAYSTVRALVGAYSGNLYQVKNAQGKTRDVGVLATNGFANSADQDAFCGTDACTISIIYDQSGNGNHLTVAPQSCYPEHDPATESLANGRSLQVGGRQVYALYTVGSNGYRNNQTTGMPRGTAGQGIYEVVDGKRYGTSCCWNFGNASTNNCDGPTGTLNALFFGIGYWGKGAGSGPWFMADMDRGVWAGGYGASNTINPNLPSIDFDYAFGILKTNTINDTPEYAIRVGDAQSGGLTTAYDGQAPAPWQLKGGIVLGIDNASSDASYGTFFEGAITSGRPSDATDDAVLANVQDVGYR